MAMRNPMQYGVERTMRIVVRSERLPSSNSVQHAPLSLRQSVTCRIYTGSRDQKPTSRKGAADMRMKKGRATARLRPLPSRCR
eukprot:1143072-Pleurochrysis_carterae.AAC.1